MNQPRRYVAATALGGLLYAVGGYDGISVLDSVEVYNPKLDQWKRVESMSNARRHVAVGVLENKEGDSSGSGKRNNDYDLLFLETSWAFPDTICYQRTTQ